MWTYTKHDGTQLINGLLPKYFWDRDHVPVGSPIYSLEKDGGLVYIQATDFRQGGNVPIADVEETAQAHIAYIEQGEVEAEAHQQKMEANRGAVVSKLKKLGLTEDDIAALRA